MISILLRIPRMNVLFGISFCIKKIDGHRKIFRSVNRQGIMTIVDISCYSSMFYPSLIDVCPPGGANTREDGRPVMTQPPFILLPETNAFCDSLLSNSCC